MHTGRSVIKTVGNYLEKRRIRAQVLESGFWFIDIPRTGSTSIKTILGKAYGELYGKTHDYENGVRVDNFIKDHTSARKVRKVLSRRIWDRIYTFSYVRNPWSRFYSIYKYRQLNGYVSTDLSFCDYAAKLKEGNAKDPDSPMCAKEFYLSLHDYLGDNRGRLLVKEWFKIEDREASLEIISSKIGFQIENIQRNRTSNVFEYIDAYDDAAREIVGEFYRDDIEFFGYAFDGGSDGAK